MPSKSSSKSSKSDKQPKKVVPVEPVEGQQWVPNLPRLPHIQTQEQNPEMGRRSEAAFCKGCGTIANTQVKYLKGAQCWYWSALGWLLVGPVCLVCFLGC